MLDCFLPEYLMGRAIFGPPPSTTCWAACRWPRPAIPDLRGILAGVAAQLFSSGKSEGERDWETERAYCSHDLVTWTAPLPTRSSHNLPQVANTAGRQGAGGSANVKSVRWLRTFWIYSWCSGTEVQKCFNLWLKPLVPKIQPADPIQPTSTYQRLILVYFSIVVIFSHTECGLCSH